MDIVVPAPGGGGRAVKDPRETLIFCSYVRPCFFLIWRAIFMDCGSQIRLYYMALHSLLFDTILLFTVCKLCLVAGLVV